MFSNEDAEPPCKAERGLLWILVYQNYQLMSGHKQGNARGITHTRAAAPSNTEIQTERIYLLAPSICRCVTEHRLIVLEIYIYLGLNYPCQTTRSRTTLLLLAFPFFRSLRSLRITLVNVGVRPTSPDL